MENTSYITLSRQMALARHMNMIANNLANMNTPAYQGSQMLFSQYLSNSETVESKFDEKLAFVQDQRMSRNTSAGAFVPTTNSLDFAIQGDGYFVLDTPLGERYTRNGKFTVGADGNLVNSLGYRVKGADGNEIPLPPDLDTLEVTPDGIVRGKLLTPEGATPTLVQLGQIQVATFENQQMMTYTGFGMLRANEGFAPIPAPDAQVLQGVVEQSNINALSEFSRMMNVTRSYTSAQNLMQTEHERMRRAYRILAGNS